MGLFISIHEGPSPSKADPIIAISDPILVEILGKEISNRMASQKKRTGKEKLKEVEFNEEPYSQAR